MVTLTAAYKSFSDQFRFNFQEITVNTLEEGATALMYACQQENIEQLRLILNKKLASVRERDRTLKTVLHYCAENISLNCAEEILKSAPDLLNLADENGYTTLHLAVIAGNTLMVNFLLSQKADANKLDTEKHSVIHWATVCGEVEILETLLKYGANASTADIHGGYPIHYAAQMCGSGSSAASEHFTLGLAVLKVLLKYSSSSGVAAADVTVVDHDGRHPLLWAASAGSSEAILTLINAGATVQSHDKDGLTAVHCAASRGHRNCLETLIELCGADVQLVDNNGCTALFYAVTLGHADATQYLLKCGANPNVQDHKGRTPAHCGASRGQFETLKILSKYNGDLWIRNGKGDYCLHEAVASGRKDLVKWLLSQRPNSVNFSNTDGRCPLHIAALTNNIEMCKILLDSETLVNPVMKSNKEGKPMTPLDAALHKNNRACAKYLQLHGAVPANRLTSYSAALRGPKRLDFNSDYYESTESKLIYSANHKGYRSLDTSPSAAIDYHEGFSRSTTNLQVHVKTKLLACDDVKKMNNPINEKHINKKYSSEKLKHDRNITTSTAGISKKQNDTSNHDDKAKAEKRMENRQQNVRRSDDLIAGSTASNLVFYYSNDNDDDDSDACKDEKKIKTRTKRRKRKKKKTSYMNTTTKVSSVISTASVGKGTTKNAHQHYAKRNKESKCYSYVRVNNSVAVASTLPQQKNADDADVQDAAAEVNIFSSNSSSSSGGDESRYSDSNRNWAVQRNKQSMPNEDEAQEIKYEKFSNENFSQEPAKEVAAAAADNHSIEDDDDNNNNNNNNNFHETGGDGEESVRNTCKWEKTDKDNEQANKKERVKKNYVGPDFRRNNYSTATAIIEGTYSERLVVGLVGKEEGNNVSRNTADANATTIIPGTTSSNNEKNNLTNDAAVPPPSEEDKGIICVILEDENFTNGRQIKLVRKKERKPASSTSKMMRIGKNNKLVFEKNHSIANCITTASFKILTNDVDEERTKTEDDESAMQVKLPVSVHAGGNTTTATTIASFNKKMKSSGSRIPRATQQKKSIPDTGTGGSDVSTNINVTSVTQTAQNTLRRYYLERRIFHTLLELKRLQIRAGKSNEQILVKRLIDDYQKFGGGGGGFIVGVHQYDGVYSFKHFERYLYEQLRLLQSTAASASAVEYMPRIRSSSDADDFEKLTKALKRTRAGKTLLENRPQPPPPLYCICGTHRCVHATHAYTGIPCAAYISKINHHFFPKIINGNPAAYEYFLPKIDASSPALAPVHQQPPIVMKTDTAGTTNELDSKRIKKSLRNVDPSKPITLELIHGMEKQTISLPTEKLDTSKRQQVRLSGPAIKKLYAQERIRALRVT